MTYFRKRPGMGDGPVTSPTEVDDTLIVGEVAPKRVGCAQLPADSPWREPGQVCAGAPVAASGPANGLSNLLDYFAGLFGGVRSALPSASGPAPAAPIDGTSKWLLLAGAGGLAYYLMTKKKGA